MSLPGAPPPSDRTATAPPTGPPAGRPPERLERIIVDLQDAGLAPSELERVVSWWKRFGGRRAAILAFAVTLPLLRYEYVPYVLSSSVETLAEGYGLDLTVGEWEGSLTDIKVVGKDVEVTTSGPFREKRLFRAREVEFDWSLTRALANGWTRVKGCWTAIVFQPCTLPEEVFHRITVDGASLHLERSLAGAWNAEEAFRPETLDALASALGRWRIPSIEGREVTVSWVEHLPGDSGGGLLEQRFSSLDFSKVSIAVANLQVPVDERVNAARVTFDGQTADGQVSVTGQMNVSRWDGGAWAPSYDMTFRLVNVGAATVARFAAPDATVVPKTGVVDGTIRLAHDGARTVACQIEIALRDVTYAPNPRSPYSRARGKALEAQLLPVRVNEVVSRDCRAPLTPPGPGDRPFPLDPPRERRVSETLQTMVTADALDTAPPLVRGAASFDQAMVIGRVPTAAEIAGAASAQIGMAIAGQRGAEVAKAVTANDNQGGNAVSRGARGLGRGIRRLFGGDSKSATKPPSD